MCKMSAGVYSSSYGPYICGAFVPLIQSGSGLAVFIGEVE